MGSLATLPLAIVSIILASIVLVEAETQAFQTENRIHRQLASNPYTCTAKQLVNLQSVARKGINTLESALKKLNNKKTNSTCLPRVKTALRKFSSVKTNLASYKFLAAEKILGEIRKEFNNCSSEKLYKSITKYYDTALTLLYSSASCYYSLYPMPPAPAPAKK